LRECFQRGRFILRFLSKYGILTWEVRTMRLMKSKIVETWIINADTWLGEDPEAIRQWMDNVLNVFAEIFGHKVLLDRNVAIINGNNYSDAPIVHPKRYERYKDQENEYVVYLKTSKSAAKHWEECTFYYQAAHEFSHVLMKCHPEPTFKCFQWISESLCQAASYYILSRLYSQLPGDKKQTIRQYLIAATNLSESIIKNQPVSVFYHSNRLDFWRDPNGVLVGGVRPRNGVIALAIQNLLQENLSGWSCIFEMDCKIPPEDVLEPNDELMKRYFTGLLQRCRSNQERQFVSDFSKLLKI